ncbi:dihydrolipoyltranssuccinylase [uncultured Gammaproteobacteria bacterium]
MTTEIKVPTLGESVTEATVARWLKPAGATVAVDELLVELETDKVTLEVPAPAAGILAQICATEGDVVGLGAVLGIITAAGEAVAIPAVPPPVAVAAAPAPTVSAATAASGAGDVLSPAVRKLIDDNKLDPSKIKASGKDGRLTKEDVLAYLEAKPATATAVPAQRPADLPKPPVIPASTGPRARADREERVRMTRLRQRIAERLKDAQNTAAMLTTFNEVDMTNVIALRNEMKEVFEKKHGTKLGFMSFFVKASVAALKELPAVNGEIDGTDMVYKNYYDIGVAVGTPQGLVVPVLRDADKLNFAQIEKGIGGLGKKARDGKLSMDEMTGGTFTITNGGVYGSLMSTPILNPPQSGIMGMHKTMDRPMAINGKVEIRPMMYLALSYDHRIIDGREAVTFLVRVKECIEDPRRLLLDI